MRVRYDSTVDAAYIYLATSIAPGAVKNTYVCDPAEVHGDIHLDFDASGRLVGIEVLDASRICPSSL